LKIGVWWLKGVRRNNEQRVCSMCSKEEDWGHVLRCEGTNIWRDEILDKKFRNVDTEIGIRRIVCARIKSSGRESDYI
jgi:hypothetical protein